MEVELVPAAVVTEEVVVTAVRAWRWVSATAQVASSYHFM